jgi:hypothetical protein
MSPSTSSNRTQANKRSNLMPPTMSAMRAAMAWSWTGVRCISVLPATISTVGRLQKSWLAAALPRGYAYRGSLGPLSNPCSACSARVRGLAWPWAGGQCSAQRFGASDRRSRTAPARGPPNTRLAKSTLRCLFRPSQTTSAAPHNNFLMFDHRRTRLLCSCYVLIKK